MYKITESYYNKTNLLASLEISKLANFILTKLNAPKNCSVSINFVDEETIKKLNYKFRNINKATDVLSFECDGVDDKFIIDTNFDLGDIFICSTIAEKNSIKFSTTLKNEILLLVTHGLLHLCGYDHKYNKEAQIMEEKEYMLLKEWDKISNK